MRELVGWPDEWTPWFFWGFTMIIVGSLIFFAWQGSDACENKGGVSVKYACIKKECIIP